MCVGMALGNYESSDDLLMDLAAHFVDLLEYTEWANRRVLAVVADLPKDDLASPVGAGILGVLAHVAGVQLGWSTRLNGTVAEPFEAESPAGIAEAFDTSHAQFRELASSLGSRAWDSRPIGGNADLATLLSQLTLHGVQHRAEVGLMLEAIGRSVGDLDYLKFKMERLSGS